jgi:hypothetical protein
VVYGPHQTNGLLGRKSNSPQAETSLIQSNNEINLDVRNTLSMASNSHIEILECFQSKAFCMIVDALWFVPNMIT